MLLTRLKPDTNVRTLTAALPKMLAHRLANDRFGVLTVEDKEGAKHDFLLQANHKNDADVKLLDTAGTDKTVTFSIRQGDTDQLVTGKLTGYCKNENNAWYKTKYIGTALGGITAGITGTLSALFGFAGSATLGTIPAPALGVLGLGALMGGIAAFSKALQNSDGTDWPAQLVFGSLEAGQAEAAVKSIESAAKPVAALPAPAKNDFILPPALMAPQEQVLFVLPEKAPELVKVAVR